MLFIIIKNNFKLMLRSKMIIVMMIVAPILVIAALSNSFQGLLNNEYNMEDVRVGYCFEEDSPFYEYKEELCDMFEEQNITAEEYSANSRNTALEQGTVDVFLYGDGDKCQVVSGDTESVKTKVCVYAMEQFLENYHLGMLNVERVMKGKEEVKQVSVKSDSLPYMKTADAEDYYGIIEIVYFLWCGLIFMTAVVQSERKNKLQKRFVISPASGMTLYLGKFIPCELMTVGAITISALISNAMFGIHWGNIMGSIGILFLVSLAATSFGIFLLYLVNNLAVSVIILFMAVWVTGFLGGSFETYMYSSIPESMKVFSPIYYANRTLVEYSTMGSSNYTGGCVLYMLVIFAFSVIFGSLLMNRRMEEN